MKILLPLVTAAAAALVASPIAAQAPAAAAAARPTAGATVYDTSGGEVGTIESVNGDLVVLSTGTNKVSLPVASFGTSPKGPTLAMTKVQLDAAANEAAAKAAAEFRASLTSGATLYGSAGGTVGTIKAVDDQFVTVTTSKGDVKLPMNAVGKGEKGPMIGMTVAELEAAAAAAAGSASTQPTTNTPPAN